MILNFLGRYDKAIHLNFFKNLNAHFIRMKNSKNMPKKSSTSIEYEETYDNFDPKKDTDEWSKMIKERNTNLTNTKYKPKASNSNCCLKRFERIFNSHSFHAIIIILVVLECFFVAGEFIVNCIQTNLSKDHSEQTNKDILLSKQSDIEMINNSSTMVASPDYFLNPDRNPDFRFKSGLKSGLWISSWIKIRICDSNLDLMINLI
jgi:hypothetical protein